MSSQVKNVITQREIMDVLTYSPETGEFRWITSGKLAASAASGRSYIGIGIKGVRYSAHVLAWIYMTGQAPLDSLDHINLDRRDNRFCNLRLATPSQNNANQPVRRTNKLGLKGVLQEPWGRFRARLTHKDKRYCGGFHDTTDEAAHAYNKLAIAIFGEFATLNPIGQDKESCK